MRKVVWLNHWFSTAYNIINLIKQDESTEFYIIGTNELDNSVLKQVCNEWYKEPEDAKNKEYIDFCLDFCRAHNVDIFMPHRHLQLVSQYKSKFEDIGVKVMVDDYEIVSILNDKNRAYDYFENHDFIKVPDYYVVETLDDFLHAYHKLESTYGQVCFKFVKDEGGKSYRLIDNNRKGYASLFKKQNTRMTLDLVVEALSEKERFSPIMVMPFLNGDEISVDCLRTNNGTIMIPRVKDSTRFEKVKYDPDILFLCEKVLEKTKLECPCNVQFKYLDNVPYFLEVNTRMSGGIHMTCLASGINIPNIAINKLLGVDKKWVSNREERIISQVELPVIL